MQSVTLQTGDTIVVSGDQLGQLQFAASAESDGSAANLIVGRIECRAEGSFSSVSNPASLVFATSSSDAAAAVDRLKISDSGHVLPTTDNSYDLGNINLGFRNAYFSEGVVLDSNTPASTTNKLYNEGGTLKFNGSAFGGTTYSAGSGIIIDASNNLHVWGGSGHFAGILFHRDQVRIGNNHLVNTAFTTDGIVAIGNSAGRDSNNAGNLICVASGAGFEASGSFGGVFLGKQAGYRATGCSETVSLGYQSSYTSRNVTFGVMIGYQAGFDMKGDTQSNNIFIGTEAGYLASGCFDSVFVGRQTGRQATGVTDTIAMGYQACYLATGLTSCVAIGTNAATSAGPSTTTCVFIGPNAGNGLASGTQSVFVGDQCGQNSDRANGSTAVGYRGMVNSTGIDFGVAIGYGAMANCVGNGDRSIAIGVNALSECGTGTLAYNSCIAIGDSALVTSSGSFNIEIGDFSIGGGVIKNVNNKLSLAKVFLGDHSTKKMAVGNVYSTRYLTPAATFEIVPANINDIGCIVSGVAISPSDVDLQRWQNYGRNVATMSCSGVFTITSAFKTPTFANTDGGTITFDMDRSNFHTVTLGGNRTLAVSNVAVGQRFMLRLLQDGSGNRTATWFSTIKWPGGLVPTLTTTANKADLFGFVCTSSNNYDGYVIGYNL